MSRQRLIAEAVAVLLLAGVSFTAGRAAFLQAPTQAFYQSEFGPAVMVAAGAGFVNPQPVPGGTLEAFLSLRTSTLDAGAVDVDRLVQPDQFQFAHRYLLTATGLWWRVAGMSWTRLAEIAGLTHVLATLSLFALMRLFVPVIPSLIAAAWFLASPLQLGYAPHVRDFAKGAFVLASVPLIVAIVLRARSRRALLALGAGAGVVIGVGLGFKMDVAIMAPIAIACIVLFRGSRPWTGLADKGVAVAALVVALGVTAWPVVSHLSSGGSNALHVVLLGYSDWFDARLGIEPGAYSFLRFYSDAYLRNLLQARSADVLAVAAPMPSAAYDAVAFELWTQWLRLFPADVFTRLLAAVDGVLDLAFQNPPAAMAPRFFDWLNGWHGWGWVLGIVLVGAGARAGTGVALFAAALLMALAGYPSLQYDPRHYFHLQAVPIAIVVAFVWQVVTLALAPALRAPATDPAKSAAPVTWRRAALVTALVTIATTLAPVVAAREYQTHRVGQVINTFLHGAREAVAVEFVALPGHRWLVRWSEVGGPASRAPGIRASYYVAEFRADEPRSAMTIGLRYSAAPDWTPCAVTRRLATAAGTARFAFPVYSLDGESAFEGIEMGDGMRDRLLRIYRLVAGPAGVPVELRLASDWPNRRLFQRLAREASFVADDVGVAVTSIGDQCGSEIAPIDSLLAKTPDGVFTIDQRQSSVAVSANGFAISGVANDTAANLVEFKPLAMAQGEALVAQLWIDTGSVAVGLMSHGTWVGYAVTARPGLSVVIVRAPEAGTFVPAVAGADPSLRSQLKFAIDRLQIVRADGTVRTEGPVLP